MAGAALSVVTLGPLAFSAGVVVLLAGVIAAFLVAGWFQRRGRASVEYAWLLLALSLLGARVGFVLRWWSDYVAHPLDMVNVRDGGFLLLPGLLVLAVVASLLAWRRRRLRVPVAWSVGAGVLVWGFVSLIALRLEVATAAPLPALVLHDLDGRAVKLQDMRGRPLVINLWATWCGPCRRELPTLVQAQRRVACEPQLPASISPEVMGTITRSG